MEHQLHQESKQRRESVLRRIRSAKSELAILVQGGAGRARCIRDTDSLGGYDPLAEEVVGDGWDGSGAADSSYTRIR